MELDSTDIAILRCLQADARMSLRDIAKAIGVSTPTVSARLSTLENLGIVKGYAARLDPDRLSETSVTLVVKAKLQGVDAVAAELAKLPWSRRVTIARAGRILVDATAVRAADVDALLDAVAKIADVVDAEHFVAVRTVKDEPRAIVAERLTTTLTCFECKGPIAGEPLKKRLDGRDHYFCCPSCERLYVAKYEKVKAGIRGRSPPTHA